MSGSNTPEKKGLALFAYAVLIAVVAAAFTVWHFSLGIQGGEGSRVHVVWAILAAPVAIAFAFFAKLMLASRRKIMESKRDADRGQ